jgi:hypothetical protein
VLERHEYNAWTLVKEIDVEMRKAGDKVKAKVDSSSWQGTTRIVNKTNELRKENRSYPFSDNKLTRFEFVDSTASNGQCHKAGRYGRMRYINLALRRGRVEIYSLPERLQGQILLGFTGCNNCHVSDGCMKTIPAFHDKLEQNLLDYPSSRKGQ